MSTPAQAQEIIQYDDVLVDTQAVVTCGFCAAEKFGTIFYELGSGGGLPQAAFPFTLNSVQVAVAGTQVTGDIFTGYQCNGTTTGGTVSANLEIYAGTQVPATITTMPGTGAWPGETTIAAVGPVMLQRSVDSAPGANMYNIQLNTLAVGATIPTPHQYLRVVITIPSGGSSASCMDLGFQSPAISPFRDNNGRAGTKRNFIYQLGLVIPELMINQPPEWTWAEDVNDPITMQQGINGDWMLRLDITRSGVVNPDAGVPDSGPMTADAGDDDAGMPPEDAAAPDATPPADTGVVADSGVAEDSGVIADSGVGDDAGQVALPAPTITDISPDSTAQGSAAAVTVVGTGFVDGLSLKIGAISAEVKSLGGSTTINADVPAGIAGGTYDVVVSNPDGQSAILSNGFKVISSGGGPALGSDGCRCVAGRAAPHGAWALAGLLLLGLRRRRGLRLKA